MQIYHGPTFTTLVAVTILWPCPKIATKAKDIQVNYLQIISSFIGRDAFEIAD